MVLKYAVRAKTELSVSGVVILCVPTLITPKSISQLKSPKKTDVIRFHTFLHSVTLTVELTLHPQHMTLAHSAQSASPASATNLTMVSLSQEWSKHPLMTSDVRRLNVAEE